MDRRRPPKAVFLTRTKWGFVDFILKTTIRFRRAPAAMR